MSDVPELPKDIFRMIMQWRWAIMWHETGLRLEGSLVPYSLEADWRDLLFTSGDTRFLLQDWGPIAIFL